MKIKISILTFGFMAILLFSTLAINSSAEKMPFSTDKTDRTLIKEIVVEQKELRAQQKEILKLLKEIKKMLSEQE